MTKLPILQPRSCGTCTACCTALQVKSLGKADYEPCKHLRRGPIKGCGIYKTRPEDCSGYECLWRAGIIEAADFRPDKCGFVLSGSMFKVADADTGDESSGAYIMIHEIVPGASRTPRANAVLEAISEAGLVIEITRSGLRKVRGGPAEQVQRIIDLAKEKMAEGVPGYLFEEKNK